MPIESTHLSIILRLDFVHPITIRHFFLVRMVVVPLTHKITRISLFCPVRCDLYLPKRSHSVRKRERRGLDFEDGSNPPFYLRILNVHAAGCHLLLLYIRRASDLVHLIDNCADFCYVLHYIIADGRYAFFDSFVLCFHR